MFFRIVFLFIVPLIFLGLGMLLVVKKRRYGSLRNALKFEQLEVDSYWLPKGTSPFGDVLAVRVVELKNDYIKFEVTPGCFDSAPLRQFLNDYDNVRDEGYKFPNLYDVWQAKSENPFDDVEVVRVLELRPGWVSFLTSANETKTQEVEEFIRHFKFKDFGCGEDSLLQLKCSESREGCGSAGE